MMIIPLWIIAICEVIRAVQNLVQIKYIRQDTGARDNAYAEFVKSLKSTDREFVKRVLEEFEDNEPTETHNADCISRSDALRRVENVPFVEKHPNVGLLWKEWIKSLPPVHPIHGEWIHFTDDIKDYARCSCCGYGDEGEVLLSDITPYCPVCGARMEAKT